MPAKRKPEDELTEEELPEAGLHEGDRPISTDAYLDEDSICFFPGPDAKLPSQTYIASGVGVLDLIKSLVIKNPEGPGIKTVDWRPGQPIPEKVMGIVPDQEMVDYIQTTNNGRGILLRDPNGNIWKTLAEWEAEFKTNGLGLLARMRLDWFTTGGGVGTPGQRVTGPGQHGIARPDPEKKFVQIGGKGGRKYP